MKKLFTALLFVFATAAQADDCRLPDGSSQLGALVDTSFLPACEVVKPQKIAIAVAAAPAAKQAKAKAAEQAGVPIPYLVGDDE